MADSPEISSLLYVSVLKRKLLHLYRCVYSPQVWPRFLHSTLPCAVVFLQWLQAVYPVQIMVQDAAAIMTIMTGTDMTAADASLRIPDGTGMTAVDVTITIKMITAVIRVKLQNTTSVIPVIAAVTAAGNTFFKALPFNREGFYLIYL